MKQILTFINSLIPLTIITIVILIIIYISTLENETRNNYFEDKGAYTIAEIILYSPQTADGCSASTRIAYKVNRINYYEESGYNVPGQNGPKAGEQFMAIYLPNKPKECAVLFNYPVKDSTDYKRYLEEFKTNPPKLK
jgi:hypothetical protein